MGTRQVTYAIRNSKGNLVALCQPGEPWSPIEKGDAIDEIEHGRNKYYVEARGLTAEIIVVKGPHGKYLRTKPDNTNIADIRKLHGCRTRPLRGRRTRTWPLKACIGPPGGGHC